MFESLVEKVKENKAQLIRVGGAVVGAVIGTMIVAALTAPAFEEDFPLLEEADEPVAE